MGAEISMGQKITRFVSVSRDWERHRAGARFTVFRPEPR